MASVYFVWKSSLIMVGPVVVQAAAWDSFGDCLQIVHTWRVPLHGPVELLTGGVVSNFDDGLCEAYIVFKNNKTLWVGYLDFEHEILDCEVKMSLEDLFMLQTPPWQLEGCWIMNGPMLLTSCNQKILIAFRHRFKLERISSSCAFEMEEDGCQWGMHILHFTHEIKIIYCGDLSYDDNGPELLLGIKSSSIEQARPCTNWSYFRIALQSVGNDHLDQNSSKWHVISWNSVFKQLSDSFPAGLKPDLISCASLVPAAPHALATALSHVKERALCVPGDLVVGTRDKRVVHYREGQVVAVEELEDVPTSLNFAVMKDGSGVIFAALKDSGLVALSAKTGSTFERWTGVQLAAVGDVQMKGHDQVLLIPSATKVPCLEFEHLLKSIMIIDSTGGDQTTEGEADEQHKMILMHSIIKSLQTRARAGLLELENAKMQMEEKISMLSSSCQLMEDMVAFHLNGEHNTSFLAGSESRLRPLRALVKVKEIKHFTVGKTLLISVHLEDVCSRLSNINLALTTLHGKIYGRSSNLISVHSDGGCHELVATIPIEEFDFFSFDTVNILMIGDICHEKSYLDKLKGFEESNAVRRFGLWLGRIQVNKKIILEEALEANELPVMFRKVSKSFEINVNVNGKENYLELLQVFNSDLHMAKRRETIAQSLDRASEFVAGNWHPWADATVAPSDRVSKVILRAEDCLHLSFLKGLLLERLKNHFGMLWSSNFSKLLGTVKSFAKLLQTEVKFRRASLSKQSTLTDPKAEYGIQQSQILSDRHCLSLLTFYAEILEDQRRFCD